MTQATPVDEQQTAHRAITSQLSEDLDWLENHCRKEPEFGKQTSQLRYAAALVRNLIGPYLNGQEAKPLHVAAVGGAGAGKSTVANFLAGTTLAESNPQAGFTRHPIAYISPHGTTGWPAHLGFLGPLRRLGEPTPASLDEDVYQVRRVPLDEDALGLLENFVIWDCPDMTTWAASGYIPRLLEVTALCDVLVYVASDERYNDEIPTQFLKVLTDSGKAIIICLVKMKEENAPAFVQHFREAVLGKINAKHLPIVTIPYLNPEELADPIHKAKRFQVPLLNQITVLGSPPEATRKRSVRSAMNYLLSHQDVLLGVARNDLAALQGWRNLVQQGQVEFDNRYRNGYLFGERFHRFDEALVRLLELLELPGVGKIISGALYVVRTPYRLLKGLFNKAIQRQPTPAVPEKAVLDQALNGWLDMLRKEAARRKDTHPVWRHIDRGFTGEISQLAKERFEEGVRQFHLSQADEVDRTARAIYEELEKNPVALNTLRGSKFALEVGVITGTVLAGGINWLDLVIAPLAASVTHQLVELLGKGYVDTVREQARTRQQSLVVQYISGPMAEWLVQWPVTGGSDYERLHLCLKRIPEMLEKLDKEVTKALT